ncbi:hypothetical protein PWT90_03443 [Aphanocladium album]|nr:hypothetical protein PWT90_03443 [Aphanocladium album]
MASTDTEEQPECNTDHHTNNSYASGSAPAPIHGFLRDLFRRVKSLEKEQRAYARRIEQLERLRSTATSPHCSSRPISELETEDPSNRAAAIRRQPLTEVPSTSPCAGDVLSQEPPTGDDLPEPSNASLNRTPAKRPKKRRQSSRRVPPRQAAKMSRREPNKRIVLPTESISDEEYISEADSFSQEPLSKNDFRVYQVKTQQYTSPDNVTQYWTLETALQRFVHYVLKELEPTPLFQSYEEPVNFDMDIDETWKIEWSNAACPAALRIYIAVIDSQLSLQDGESVLESRGDFMVAFKRENTKNRFIERCRELNIQLKKVAWKELEKRWDSMQSETQLPRNK